MEAVDLDVVKEIPGYKVILKTVLKSQIQHLVEQLADHTGEESIILTASVTDGTLSHLGSESGKVFLEDNGSIKSLFLGFCLKRYHSTQQIGKHNEMPTQRPAAKRSGRDLSEPKHPTPSGVHLSHRQRQQGPTYDSSSHSSIHPVTLTRASPVAVETVSQEIYPASMSKRRKVISEGDKQVELNVVDSVDRSSINHSKQSPQIIKVEPVVDDEQNSTNSNVSEEFLNHSNQAGNQTDGKTHGSEDDYSDSGLPLTHEERRHSRSSILETSTPVLPAQLLNQKKNDRAEFSSPASQTVCHEQLSDITPSDNDKSGLDSSALTGPLAELVPVSSVDSGFDSNISIKKEGDTELETDLEITGVEPGYNPQAPGSWVAAVEGHLLAPDKRIELQAHKEYGSSSKTSEVDKWDQGKWDQGIQKDGTVRASEQNCDKYGLNSATLVSAKYIGVSFACDLCGKQFGSAGNLKRHRRVHTGEKPYTCGTCWKKFSDGSNFLKHLRYHGHQRLSETGEEIP